MTPLHESVLSLIKNGRITQQQIANQLKVGHHELHESHLVSNESTLRKVRQLIRDLRIEYGQKILSDSKGYWIPQTEQEVTDYLERLERTAKAQAKSHMVTYNCMKKMFGVESKYFEQLNFEFSE